MKLWQSNWDVPVVKSKNDNPIRITRVKKSKAKNKNRKSDTTIRMCTQTSFNQNEVVKDKSMNLI